MPEIDTTTAVIALLVLALVVTKPSRAVMRHVLIVAAPIVGAPGFRGVCSRDPAGFPTQPVLHAHVVSQIFAIATNTAPGWSVNWGLRIVGGRRIRVPLMMFRRNCRPDSHRRGTFAAAAILMPIALSFSRRKLEFHPLPMTQLFKAQQRGPSLRRCLTAVTIVNPTWRQYAANPV